MILNFISLKRPAKRIVKKNTDKHNISYERERKYNFLKYWRVVKYFVKRKYELSESDLEMLLYLYDEGKFDMISFKEFSNILHWDRDRFWKLKQRGFINVWRKRNEVANKRPIYELSLKAVRICNSVYKRLLLKEKTSEDPRVNPIMKGSSYTDRVYRIAIKKINQKIKD